MVEELVGAVRACKADFKRGDVDELIVRAVLEKMLEPTPSMISDGAFQIFRGDRITEDDLTSARGVWRAMLRTAIRTADKP